MKIVLRLLKWACFSIIVQLMLLWVLNSVYLPGRGKYVEVTRYADAEDGRREEITLPNNAQNIQISFDGSFAGYVHKGRLNVEGLDKAAEKKAVVLDNISFFRWLYDRNMVIYSSAVEGKDKCDIRVDTYDAVTGVLRSYPLIEGLPAGSRTVNIELSSLTNMVYVEVSINGMEKRIFKYNIIDELELVAREKASTIIKVFRYMDGMVYQSDTGHIGIRHGKDENDREIFFEKKAVLLSVAAGDSIYMGEYDEAGRIAKVYWGTANGYTLEREGEIQLRSPADPSCIYITRDGAIYEIDAQGGIVRNITDNTEQAYKGTLCDIAGKYLAAAEGNLLRIYALYI
ncbi:hypothetical protein DFR58_106115 [Anaerobacterium chartisolvens]|uniref:Uncharacterized protein n=1 Tax=Anaerobacterium chartisolvens TaxID=1297424 RepID=A0A369BBV3_9FIRM|nr:hypothetical protein [Anaerobacterium chartisolvens]RCX17947.1 hypothetical protein DFR58_106115 [Anaerobacterium chartisolvens]